MSDLLARHLGVLSLEPWDGVWRRNQHLVAQLLAQGLVERVTFVEPCTSGRARTSGPYPGVTAVRPRLVLPRRAGGLAVVAAGLRAGVLRDVDRLWINDAPLGRWVVSRRVPAWYDVTDDWRETVNTPRVRARLIAAEDVLASRTRTVVCSRTLAERWHARYGVDAAVVGNGVDLAAHAEAVPVALDGPGPHLGYVGTLHAERLDVDLVCALTAVGTVHLVGPDALDAGARARLDAAGVRRHGPVEHGAVPGWMAAMDVLVCPHLITPFTLSLDAIKAREYQAAGRPVVATPTSGFQDADGVVVVPAGGLVDAVALAAESGTPTAGASPPGWDMRVRELSDAVR